MNRSSAGAEEVARLQRTDLTQSADLTQTKRTSNSSVLEHLARRRLAYRKCEGSNLAAGARAAPVGWLAMLLS